MVKRGSPMGGMAHQWPIPCSRDAVFLIALIDVMACMVLLLQLIATVPMVDHVK